MIRRIALLISLAFLAAGILGFVQNPRGGLLLGMFAVDQNHNLIHLVTGAVGLLAGATGRSRLYCQAVGVVYLIVALLGLIPSLGGHMLFGALHVNSADNILHLVVGIVAAYFGFLYGTTVVSNVARRSRFG
ncbi:MAG TPA: DUF4383 domain-containing protein [Blastocatellia bacterium]|nr:DUF4383 domain-containing protein [Blastocatellia bacterium]